MTLCSDVKIYLTFSVTGFCLFLRFIYHWPANIPDLVLRPWWPGPSRRGWLPDESVWPGWVSQQVRTAREHREGPVRYLQNQFSFLYFMNFPLQLDSIFVVNSNQHWRLIGAEACSLNEHISFWLISEVLSEFSERCEIGVFMTETPPPGLKMKLHLLYVPATYFHKAGISTYTIYLSSSCLIFHWASWLISAK